MMKDAELEKRQEKIIQTKIITISAGLRRPPTRSSLLDAGEEGGGGKGRALKGRRVAQGAGDQATLYT